MSLSDYRGRVYCYRELMRLALADIESGGEVKPARVMFKAVHQGCSEGGMEMILCRECGRSSTSGLHDSCKAFRAYLDAGGTSD